MDKPIEVLFDERGALDHFCAVVSRYKVDLVVMPVELTGPSKDNLKTFLCHAGCLLLLINWKIPLWYRVRRVLARIVIRSGLVRQFPEGHFGSVGL